MLKQKEEESKRLLMEKEKELQMKLDQQRNELVEKHTFQTKQTIKQLDYSKSIKRIREANQIASHVGWTYSFKEIYIKQVTDSQGRSQSFASRDYGSLNR
mmetsp:Transcript_9410/g.14385  ORF Transcript_9410/g.14385 Transcript_9410/m.14385 type:complete len:100 (+) Transcript_9410:2318-2617(+)